MPTAYRLDDGEIIGYGDCLEHLRDAPGVGFDAAAAHSVLDGYYADGEFVAYTLPQQEAKRQRARAWQQWRNDPPGWRDTRALEQIKADRWGEIKAARDAHEFGGFEWDGSTFDSDRESQARIMGAVQMAVLAMSAAQPFEIAWTLADNAVRTLAGADMIAVGLELGAHVAAAHAIGRTLRAAIEEAETAAEVEAVQWA